MKAIGIALPLLAAGCVSTGSTIPSPAELSQAANARFTNGPVQAVFARYGMPESQFVATTGTRVLLWRATNTVRHHEPVTTTTQGAIGSTTDAPWYAPIPYRETVTTRAGYNVEYACTMQVGVKDNGTVEAIGFDGKMGACQVFVP